ncbi:MAG: hypothetical protein ACTSPB_01485 [Candidatus Thorarchaeota archaeon]
MMEARIESKEDLYQTGLDILREHSEEIMVRVMRSRREDKGNFAYLESEDIKRERRIAKALSHMLWRLHLEIEGKTETEKGYCGWMCKDCWFKRYRFHSQRAPNHWCNWEKEGWYCQSECECE